MQPVLIPEPPVANLPDPPRPSAGNRLSFKSLSAGLVAGAADDDPSGIATYSQAGAQFGFATLWTVFLTLPLMIGIQAAGAHVARVTGRGLAENMYRHFPAWITIILIGLLLAANVINLAADIGAMGEAAVLLMGGKAPFYALGFATLSMLLEVLVPFPRYAPVLKLLTLSLFAYVFTAFVVDVPWRQVIHSLLVPPFLHTQDYFLMVVAVFGTTISPYVFFWQASQEIEEEEASGVEPLLIAPQRAKAAFRRIRLDTTVGMLYSNVVAFFIMLTAAVVLHAHGVTDIRTSADAARALKPLAGNFAGAMFAIGIVGTGLLALPVLAGSAAYAVAEVCGWSSGLGRKPTEAKLFYLILVLATGLGTLLSFSSISPIRMLFWAAVCNGVISVPLMAGIMLVATRPKVMGTLVLSRSLKWLGWLATLAMAGAVAATFI